MRIGSLQFDNPVFLAPMAGVTDLPFRVICRQYGAGLVYSEMISAKGLYYHDKKTADLMRFDPAELPAAIQVFGSDPAIMGQIAPRLLETGAALIDINMGCPAPKIVSNGDGSALMKNPALAGQVMRAVADAVSCPVTVKIRKGWDGDTAAAFAKILAENGAAAITVHGRTRMEFYSGKADWDVIKRVKQAVPIPVIGNGDIFSPQNALDMMAYTGCDGVMIGRGAQGNPFLFRQIQELLTLGYVQTFPTEADRLRQAIAHTQALVADKGESRGIKEARKHIAWYLKGMRGGAALKTQIFRLTALPDVISLLEARIHDFRNETAAPAGNGGTGLAGSL